MDNTCQKCGNDYPSSFMADWSICNFCKEKELKEMGYEYMDSLGIGWTSEDLQDISKEEIEELIQNSHL